MMTWERLLNPARVGVPDGKAREEDPLRPSWAIDYDRVLFSHPFKRLAHKTQVHPLYDHDHLHNRQIHSAETASVGRSLGMELGAWLEAEGHVAAGERHRISGVLQAACLAHDLGNPPFGHSGEAAMGAWFAQLFCDGRSPLAEVPDGVRMELEAFEGNAQGFRLLTRLEVYRDVGGMRPSAAVLGAFAKYPCTAAARAAAPAGHLGAKKFGIFAAEAPYWAEAAALLGLPEAAPGLHRRHPLVFLLEAADDLCYGVLDVEDAFFSGDLSPAEIEALLQGIADLPETRLSGMTPTERIAHLRAVAIGRAIGASVEAFKADHPALMAGEAQAGLIERSTLAEPFARIRATSRARIIGSKKKAQLEVSGRNTLHRTLDGILPVYEALVAAGGDPGGLDSYQAQLAQAIDLDLRGAVDPASALHAMGDYVSGMTDRFAVKVARILSGL